MLPNPLKYFVPRKIRSKIRRLTYRQNSIHADQSFFISRERRVAARKRLEAIWWPEKKIPKIIYALTPTEDLRNVGDQAQVVAIQRWFAQYFPRHVVVEIDKDMVISAVAELERFIGPSDLIFLHSGGNLGDRGMWSETARRLMIEKFHAHPVVSLPQTIFFSDTSEGRRQKALSQRIYDAHPNLTILGRDQVSGKLARRLFSNATIDVAPDFVLSLDAKSFGVNMRKSENEDVLACLRLDDESAFDNKMRDSIISGISRPVTVFDTTIDEQIPANRRESVLADTLALFARHRSVVTDRYHGLIFSVLCQKPTVVLPTVDHKLTSAIEWFADIPNVKFCESPSEIKGALEAVERVPAFNYPDFNEAYFSPLARLVQREVGQSQ